MNELVTPLALALVAACSLWATLSPRRTAVDRATCVTVIGFAVIPTFGPSPWVAAAPVMASIVLVTLALARDGSPLRVTWGLAGICFFHFIIAAAQLDLDNLASSGLFLTQAICFCLVALASSKRRPNSGHPIFTALIALLPLEILIALLEQFRLIPAVWTRDETQQYRDITLRTNELVPQLIGRSMGTFAHPILLGTFAALTAVLCLIVALRTRRVIYYAATVGAVALIGLSGTRSAATAAIVAVVLYLLVIPGRGRIVRLMLGAVVIALVLNSQLVDRLLNADVQTSSSYIHRTRILSSIPNLLERDDAALLFGSGAGSIDDLFSQGIMVGYSTFRFFDNQYVRLLAVSGLVSLVLFAGLVIRGLIIGNAASRALLVVVLVLMASFDTLTWGFSYLVTVIAVSGPIAAPHSTRNPPLPRRRERARRMAIAITHR